MSDRTGATNDDSLSTVDAASGGSAPSKRAKRVKDEEDAMMELISHLEPCRENTDADVVNEREQDPEPTWTCELARHFSTPQFSTLAAFVAAERKSRIVFPPADRTWTALNACPLSTLKVVVVGQDPYHGPNQAHGLSFSVERGQPVPPSLRNIYRELREDPEVSNFDAIPTHGNLERWARQGVLLLNAVLTVRSGEPNSHAKRGWEGATDAILRAVVSRRNGINKDGGGGDGEARPVVFLLWGKPALAKAQTVLASAANSPRSKARRVVICTSHPSPLGATKTSSPFLGSRCFSRCNRALVEMGLEPIDWRVDGPL
jgi:uracil-DNA glycosylase